MGVFILPPSLQPELEDKISTFLVALGENDVAKFHKGLCNAWAFMNVMNDALDQKNTNIVRMQKILDQDSNQSAELYQEYKSAYVALVEAKGEGDIPELNRELKAIEEQVTKLRKENESKAKETVLQLEEKRRNLRDTRSNLIEKSLIKQFGEERYKKMKEAEELYLYINVLYAACYPEEKLKYYIPNTAIPDTEKIVSQPDYIEIFNLVGPKIVGKKDEKENKLSIEKVLDIAFNFTENELADFFDNKLANNTIRDGDMIQLDRAGHHIFYLSYKNGKYILYDPLPIELPDNKGETIAAAIKSTANYPDNYKGQLSLRIGIVAKADGAKLDRPKRIEIINKMIEEREKNGNLDLDAADNDSATAFAIAARAGHADTTALLIDKRCNINPTSGLVGRPIYTAILYNNIEVFTQLLDKGKKVYDINDTLITAAEFGNVNAIKKLLEYKADINARNTFGVTAAHMAACYGKVQALEILVECKASLNSSDNDGNTPLFIAARKGQVEVVRMLASKFPLDASEKLRLAAVAAAEGHLSIIKILEPLDLSARLGDGTTLATIAAKSGKSNVFEYLAEKKVDLSAKNAAGLTPLWLAASSGNSDIIKKILENKEIDIETKDDVYGWTVARVAAYYGQLSALETLIESKANLNSLPQDEKLKLASTAAANANFRILDTVMPIDLEAKLADGETLATIAVKNNRTEVVAYLAEKKVNLAANNAEGQTPLVLAVSAGNKEMIEMIINKKVDVNVQDYYGVTAAHIAAANGHVLALEILMENKANFNILDRSGFTPAMWAAGSNRTDVIQLLVSAVSMTEKEKLDLAEYAAKQGFIGVIIALDLPGLSAPLRSGETLVTVAAKSGQTIILQYLADIKVDLSQPNDKGETLASIAVASGFWRTLASASAANGDVGIIEALKLKPDDLYSNFEGGETLETIAVKNNRVDVLAYLAGKYADLNPKESNNLTTMPHQKSLLQTFSTFARSSSATFLDSEEDEKLAAVSKEKQSISKKP